MQYPLSDNGFVPCPAPFGQSRDPWLTPLLAQRTSQSVGSTDPSPVFLPLPGLLRQPLQVLGRVPVPSTFHIAGRFF